MKDYNGDIDAMLADYKRMAKSADQKLRRLEKLAEQPNFKNATRWAYAEAMQDLKRWQTDNQRKLRFDTPAPMKKDGSVNVTALKQKMRDIESFMEKPTSTKRGIEKSYIDRANTINKIYGTTYVWTDMTTLYNSKAWEKLATSFGSDTAMKAIGSISKKKDEILTLINNAKRKHVSIPTLIKKINKQDNPQIDTKLVNKNIDAQIWSIISKDKKVFESLFDE